ncbi:FAD-dependent monooxygenase [Pseudomonas sp. 148P]|uniref:FAD-dependent monooxygenase n=1 Tax=Pseudomonas ulcerans TaxID=3115852 RepID=A0ABU7HN15_9PSED|nr:MULTISPECIES: FAD-dependent monooxygenase [unclassified Pseudomonas]MEE1922420.1 FAD-dependent monooxygenase [Pseudomonas sp. 147P]MEE1932894.1 FAD-dependent monooxygenase [Pseudomonas sp. 148P]
MKSIVVLGAGPAGAVVALGLKRLGHEVRVVSEWRRFAALEGVSQRVLEALRSSGLQQALAVAGEPSRRHARWNSEAQSRNVEFLLDRPRFDQGLRDDLRSAGIEVIEARVLGVHVEDGRSLIELDGAPSLSADFHVEARGRQAPQHDRSQGRAERGPETLSLLNRWQGPPGKSASAVESQPDGWVWMARQADGRCYWQWTLDVAATALPDKAALLDFCREKRWQSPLARAFFDTDQEQDLQLHARSSTAILAPLCGGDNWLRVGDAAMAVDPLSGNGIFQSLSSALQAPAVINTLLTHPERRELALRFHQRRVEHLFWRFARLGRDFYLEERRWADEPFWQARRQWPDAEPVHATADFSSLRIEQAPVLREGLVDLAQVVISPDQPLGIWHLNGVELAPLVSRLRAEPADQVLAALNPEQQRYLRSWLLSQGYRP